ncbi:hypothetical protein MUP79_09965, partial [Candidatus Bathyarchaeota archaeon]|nr:hypothetical protein [Candidatus Bathyarchaeota archaeon]
DARRLQHSCSYYVSVKHYSGSVDGKLRLENRGRSLEYIKGVLDSSKNLENINPINQRNIDPNLNNSGRSERR